MLITVLLRLFEMSITPAAGLRAATFDSANILRRNAVVKRRVQIFAIASGGEICKLLL